MGCSATHESSMYLFFWCGSVQRGLLDSGYVVFLNNVPHGTKEERPALVSGALLVMLGNRSAHDKMENVRLSIVVGRKAIHGNRCGQSNACTDKMGVKRYACVSQ